MPVKRSTDVTKEVSPVSGRDEDVVRFLHNAMEAKKTLNDKVAFSEIEKTRRENIGKENFMSAERSAAFRDLREKVEDFEQKKPLSRKSPRKTWKIAVWSIFVILIIPAIIYFIILPQLGFPQYGDRFVKIANILANKLIGEQEPVRPEVVIGQVKLQDIRQRMIE